MKDDYRRTAKIYDLLFSAALRQLREDIRTFVFHKNYRHIVDICCGTGAQLRCLDRAGMELHGIDNSLAMLERARKTCSDRAEFYLLDAEQDSLAASSYDCVILSLALHEKHPTAARTLYGNCQRLLKEGGALVIADFNPPPHGILESLIGRCLLPFIEKCAGTDHYRNYRRWVKTGGLETFLHEQKAAAAIISRPLYANMLCCAVIKNDQKKIEQQNFALLYLDLRKSKKRR